jgi:hypothetical protein
MKVWEKIAKEMTKQLNHEYKTKDTVKSDMYMMRITPCDYMRVTGTSTIQSLQDVCDKSDCMECLEKYLDFDVE